MICLNLKQGDAIIIGDGLVKIELAEVYRWSGHGPRQVRLKFTADPEVRIHRLETLRRAEEACREPIQA